jgi:hypothetical protein
VVRFLTASKEKPRSEGNIILQVNVLVEKLLLDAEKEQRNRQPIPRQSLIAKEDPEAKRQLQNQTERILHVHFASLKLLRKSATCVAYCFFKRVTVLPLRS